MIFVVQLSLDDLSYDRGNTTKLRMTESISQAGVGEELAVAILHAFGDDDCAVAKFLHALLHARAELLFVEGDLWKQNDVGALAGFRRCKSAGRSDPARMTTHDFENEHFRRGFRHRGDVEPRFADRDRHIFGDR